MAQLGMAQGRMSGYGTVASMAQWRMSGYSTVASMAQWRMSGYSTVASMAQWRMSGYSTVASMAQWRVMTQRRMSGYGTAAHGYMYEAVQGHVAVGNQGFVCSITPSYFSYRFFSVCFAGSSVAHNSFCHRSAMDVAERKGLIFYVQ